MRCLAGAESVRLCGYDDHQLPAPRFRDSDTGIPPIPRNGFASRSFGGWSLSAVSGPCDEPFRETAYFLPAAPLMAVAMQFMGIVACR